MGVMPRCVYQESWMPPLGSPRKPRTKVVAGGDVSAATAATEASRTIATAAGVKIFSS